VSDVTSFAPADVGLWVSLDVHKLSIVVATLPPVGGKPDVCRIETTERAIRRFVDRLGGPAGLAVCYEAGPGGYALWRLLTSMGVACDVVAPSLVPVRAGDRVKTDRRDAKKLVALYRAGLLRFVAPPTARRRGCAICCAAATICAARGLPRATACSSNCCATAMCFVRARPPGR
jgi:transposase